MKRERDLRIQWQLFLGVAAFIAVIDVVYWFVSYEEAGTTMLTLAAGLAALCGGWLFIQDHRRPEPHETGPSTGPSTGLSTGSSTAAADEPSDHESTEHYLPTASWWPLVMGVGMVLALNGLILSWPYAVPGMAVLMLGIGGFVSDSRRRA